MTTLKLEWDQRDLKFFREKGLEKALERALKKAGSNAIRDMQAASTREVRRRKRFKIARVKKSLALTYPKGTKINSLVWRMDVRGTVVPVASMQYRQTKKGVSVAINQGRRKLIKGAFEARMKSGHVGIFTRAFRGAPRLPIREAFTTKISDCSGLKLIHLAL
jgi:hypothetical protein